MGRNQGFQRGGRNNNNQGEYEQAYDEESGWPIKFVVDGVHTEGPKKGKPKYVPCAAFKVPTWDKPGKDGVMTMAYVKFNLVSPGQTALEYRDKECANRNAKAVDFIENGGSDGHDQGGGNAGQGRGGFSRNQGQSNRANRDNIPF